MPAERPLVTSSGLPSTRMLEFRGDAIQSVISTRRGFAVRSSNPHNQIFTEFDLASGTQTSSTLLVAGVAGEAKAWEIDDTSIYMATSGRLYWCRKERGQWETKSIPLIGDAPDELKMIGGKLYVGLSSGGVVRIDPMSFESELLASASRRPAQTVLDDRKPFRVDRFVDTTAGLTVILQDKPSPFIWNESTRNFHESTNALSPKGGAIYDRELITGWVGRDGGNWKRVYNPEDILLSDPGRTGVRPVVSSWPPSWKLNGDETFPSNIIDSAVVGDRLCVFFSGGTTRGPFLKIQDRQQTRSVAIQLTEPHRMSVYDGMAANEQGVVIYGRTALHLVYFSWQDLGVGPP